MAGSVIGAAAIASRAAARSATVDVASGVRARWGSRHATVRRRPACRNAMRTAIRVSHAPKGPSPRARRERSEGGHEGLLDRILGLDVVAQDAMARPDETPRLAIDDPSERLPVPAKDGIDDGAVISPGARLGRGQGFAGDGRPPGIVRTLGAGHAGSAHRHDALARADPPGSRSCPHRRRAIPSVVVPAAIATGRPTVVVVRTVAPVIGLAAVVVARAVVVAATTRVGAARPAALSAVA